MCGVHSTACMLDVGSEIVIIGCKTDILINCSDHQSHPFIYKYKRLTYRNSTLSPFNVRALQNTALFTPTHTNTLYICPSVK